MKSNKCPTDTFICSSRFLQKYFLFFALMLPFNALVFLGFVCLGFFVVWLLCGFFVSFFLTALARASFQLAAFSVHTS